MSRLIYGAGRFFQILGLLILPMSIWAGQIGHSERQSITIFVASVLVFFLGYLLTQISSKL